MISHKTVSRQCLVRMLPFLAPNPIRIRDWLRLQSTLHLARHHHHFPLSQNDGGRAKILRMTKRIPVHGARRMSQAPLVTATSARDTSGRRVNGARCVTCREVRCHLMTSLTGYTMVSIFSFLSCCLSFPPCDTNRLGSGGGSSCVLRTWPTTRPRLNISCTGFSTYRVYIRARPLCSSGVRTRLES